MTSERFRHKAGVAQTIFNRAPFPAVKVETLGTERRPLLNGKL